MAGTITSAVKGVKNLFSREEKCKILMVGLDAAGKTTILDKLKLDGNVNEIVTESCAMGKWEIKRGLNIALMFMARLCIGFIVKTTENKAVRFTVCDVGGVSKMPIWRQYYENTQGMIIIIIADLICMSIMQCNYL